MVGGVGFEPTHPGETDLQSAAIHRLRSPPSLGRALGTTYAHVADPSEATI